MMVLFFMVSCFLGRKSLCQENENRTVFSIFRHCGPGLSVAVPGLVLRSRAFPVLRSRTFPVLRSRDSSPLYKRGRATNTASWPSFAGRFPPRVASRPTVSRLVWHRGPPLSAVSRLVWHRGSLQPALFRPAPGTVPECPDKAGLPRRWPSGALQRPPASSTKIGKITSRIEKIGVNAFFWAKNIFFQKICLYLQSQTERFSVAGNIWRDAGVVDRAALEMRCTGNCTGGSNPSLSARHT